MSEGTAIDSAERSPLRRARLPLVLVGFVVLLGLASAIGVRNTESWSSLEHLSERVLARWVPPAVGDESQLEPSAERALARLGRRLSGRLVWSSNRSGNHEIWMLELPGLERRRLTDHPHVDFFPRFSPDGSRILFQRSREEYVSGRDHRGWDLYIVELAAAGATASAERMPQPRRLAERAFRPAWAPDGRSIVFSRNLRIFRVDVASGVESQLFEPPEGFPRCVRETSIQRQTADGSASLWTAAVRVSTASPTRRAPPSPDFLIGIRALMAVESRAVGSAPIARRLLPPEALSRPSISVSARRAPARSAGDRMRARCCGCRRRDAAAPAS